MNRIFQLTFVVAIVAVSAVGSSSAATYFVRPTGNDHLRGTTLRTAWRTVERVNRARLAPGDRVLFEGGATFSDRTLMPRVSGSATRPIRFSSFGHGLAHIVNDRGAVWFSGKHDIVFDRLWLSSANSGSSVVGGSSAGSTRIRVSRSWIVGTRGAGIISPSSEDSHWRLTCNRIESTGDSGIIILGSRFFVSGNLIRNAGWNPEIDYGKHGIYAKGEGLVVKSNVIERFADIGISLRAPNSRVIDNTIADGPFAIAFHDESSAAGHSLIHGNVGYGISKVGFYFAPDQPASGGPAAERFTISRNTFNLAELGIGFDIGSASRNLMTMTGNTAKSRSISTAAVKRSITAIRRGCTRAGNGA